jgi:hypothetical protein
VVGAPLPGAIAADLAILRIQGKLPFAILMAALPLARFGRAGHLLRVKSRGCELLLTERARPLLHPPRVNSFCSKNFNWKKNRIP